MRYALALSALMITGCVSTADYQPPAGHPASAHATDSPPPVAADPFTIQPTPIEASTNPQEGMDHHGHADHQEGGR